MSKINDFNDLHKEHGIEAVEEILRPIVLESVSVLDKEEKKSPIKTPAKKISYNTGLREKFIELFPWNSENPCADFTLEYLPPLLRNYIQSICDITHGNSIIITASVLTSISAYIKTKLVHYIAPRKPIFPNLWLLCLADSGCLKSTAMELGMELVLRNESKIYEEIDRIKSLHGEDSDKGKEEINKQLSKTLILPNSGSFAGLEQHLKESHGGAMYIDELRQFLDYLEIQYNSGAKPKFTSLYNVPRNYSVKTKTQGSFVLKYPFVSLCSISTVEWFEKAGKDEKDWHSGFWTRFLPFYIPPRKEKIPTFIDSHINFNDEYENELYSLLRWLQRQPIINDDFGAVKKYTRSKAATIYCEVIDDIIYDLFKPIDNAGIFEKFRNRFVNKILQLSMLMQVIFDRHSNEISGAAILAAYSIEKHSIDSLVNLFSNTLAKDDFDKCIDKVLSYVEKTNIKLKYQGVPRWKIMQNMKPKIKSRELDEVMKNLEESNLMKIQNTGTKKADWLYTPLTYGTTTITSDKGNYEKQD
jgi:hypothetical protein